MQRKVSYSHIIIFGNINVQCFQQKYYVLSPAPMEAVTVTYIVFCISKMNQSKPMDMKNYFHVVHDFC